MNRLNWSYVATVLVILLVLGLSASNTRTFASAASGLGSVEEKGPAHGPQSPAATYIVDTNLDTNLTACTDAAADCTLRGALNNANANSSTDIINFALPGPSFTINVTGSGLPPTIYPVVIDGYSQSGARCNTLEVGNDAVLLIELDGSGLSANRDLLWSQAGGLTVRGLMVNRAPRIGIDMWNGGNNTVEGNFIGTDPSGTQARGNGFAGVYLTTLSGSMIGGTSPCARNLISGNNIGIGISDPNTSNIVVQGNYIGTDRHGINALPNWRGMYITAGAFGITIGGPAAGARNIISGNSERGIMIFSVLAPGNRVQGNYIGANVAGDPLSNGWEGIYAEKASDLLIGGTGAGEGNLIANNGTGPLGGAGVDITYGPSYRNAILSNSIYSNVGLGISFLGFDIPAQNDLNDPDDGPNYLQNYPVLTSVIGGVIVGTLNSTANTSFVIEFFASPTCDPSNHGEGQLFLGRTSVTTLGNNISFQYAPSPQPPPGWFITMTATDPGGNTSEFSRCGQVPLALTPTHTNTPALPTLTPTHTNTPVLQTSTRTPTHTNTPALPTHTNTPALPTHTNTPALPTHTPTTQPTAASATASVTCTPAPTQLIAWYPLDERTGTPIAHDIVGAAHGNHASGPEPIPGKVDFALRFDGVDDYVEVPASLAFNPGTGGFSIDTWIRTTQGSGRRVFIDKRGPGPVGYALFLDNGKPGLQLADASGVSDYIMDGAGIADGQWHMVAVTVQRNPDFRVLLCVDGTSSCAVWTAPVRDGDLSNPAALWFGRDHLSNFRFAGDLDEVEFFNRPLTKLEMRDIYDAGGAGKCKPTTTPTATAVPEATPCPLGTPIVYTGAITASDGTQLGRLYRDDPGSICNIPQPCAVFDTTSRHYDVYTFHNCCEKVCVTVELDAGDCVGNRTLQSTAYLHFDPANICQTYLGDIGDSPNPVKSYSFMVPAQVVFQVVVNEVNPDSGCSNYNLTVNGLSVPPPGCLVTPSATPTATHTVSPTPAATSSPTCQPLLKVYTTNADFDEGSYIHAGHHVQDQLQLVDTPRPLKYLWVAVSGKGTIVKIDTETGDVLGEYWSSPAGQPKNPSRTTVEHSGGVWASNRDGNSVLHIGLLENGGCVDRDGDLVIETSTGLHDILPWTNAGGTDTDGGVATAQDECIRHYTRVSSSGTRHVSVDANNDVWVSGTGGRIFDLLDGDTGLIDVVRGPEGPVVGPLEAYGGYGGLIDHNGVLWSASGSAGPSGPERSLLRWDPWLPNGDPNPLSGPNGYPDDSTRWMGYNHDSYGLCMDSQSNVWNTSVRSDQIRKFSPDGLMVLGPVSAGNPQPNGTVTAQGCVVGDEDHVWVAHSYYHRTVGHLLPDGTWLGNVTVASDAALYSGPTGLAVDQDGKIWATNYNDHTVVCIDPDLGPLGTDGITSVGALCENIPPVDLGYQLYNYSDETGSTLTGLPQNGTWEVVYDSDHQDVTWGFVTWNAYVPDTGALTVFAASSVDGENFSSPQEVQYGVDLTVPDGQYLKVTVRFTRASASGNESPILYDLTIATCNYVVPPTPTPVPHSWSFSDVPLSNPFYPFVSCLAYRGVVSGYACGGSGELCNGDNEPYFRPNQLVTRGQLVKIVALAAGFAEDPGAQIYEDGPFSNPFYRWINQLTRRGYVSGYACGGPGEPCSTEQRPYFRPGANATRGQSAKIVANAAVLTGTPTGQSFTDVPPTHPFYRWIEQIAALGVIGGYGCGGPGEPCDPQQRPYFRPAAAVTRGQSAKIVANTFYPNCQTP
jgi:hypothetical protein